MMTGPYCHHLMVVYNPDLQLRIYYRSVWEHIHRIQSFIISVVIFFDHNITEY